MSIDRIGDFLTVIRNAVAVRKSQAVTPYSQLKESVAKVLKSEGYIHNYSQESGEGVRKYLKISLKYVSSESVIHEIKRVSKPSRRLYHGYKFLTPIIGGLGIAIVSTNRGVMTDRQARKEMVGGEVLCSVW